MDMYKNEVNDGAVGNNRRTQDLGGRTVYMKETKESDAATSLYAAAATVALSSLLAF